MRSKKTVQLIVLILLPFIDLPAGQIDIPRIEQMPNHPRPYYMRDWKKITLGYDSLVFNLQSSGSYMPLIWMDNSGVNYPNHARFGMQSYVGTSGTNQGEAINVLPAVVSATLCGIDKSDQNGINWVEMCEEFFNRQNGELVYLNGYSARSGGDWWYDTMPNIFFYQLYHFYPEQGDFSWQFEKVASRWLEAIEAMGGSATPWNVPDMDHWAWNLADMKPVDREISQPEAAGALAWLEYMAYVKTDREQFRLGAEWAMEFLSGQSRNPSYELQLPYGVYTAARMNAELGTDYDVEKLLNWCFDTEGNRRSWGMTLGNWGGYDCYGLIGEAVYAGYAFAMNGFEMAGALVPMVRYDDRFARAIGKWMLHLANASRLFYSNQLPAYNQDSEVWAFEYDPRGYIAYEALREQEAYSGTSPFATGDAKKNGWAATNLGLYGSSHVGNLGAIIDTTNVSKILKLDLLKTDYFGKAAYPSWLFYNPFDQDTSVLISLPDGQHDVYDAVSNQFVLTSQSGNAEIPIEADQAFLAVITPTGGYQQETGNRLTVDGVVVDYEVGQALSNYRPRIKALAAQRVVLSREEQVEIYCSAQDPEQQKLTYLWQASGGTLSGSGAVVTWTAPGIGGSYSIQSVVQDESGAADTAHVKIDVLENRLPQIQGINADPAEVLPGKQVLLSCMATDYDGDSLTYVWKAREGTITGQGRSVVWQAPATQGLYKIVCQVSDNSGTVVSDSIGVVVGDLVAWFAFSGNTGDSSAFGNDGRLYGAEMSPDQAGRENSAYWFDGVDDYIRVPVNQTLNFQRAVTVSCWMRVDEFFSNREAYPLSHGNWQNRWKISITNRRIRWTVNTTDGIKDLDSKLELAAGKFYHIACTYDGKDYRIYIDGQLDNSTTHSGLIRRTDIDLTIGQTLPNEQQYNFKGVLDEIRIYNRALEADEIAALFDSYTGLKDAAPSGLAQNIELLQNFPNPFNGRTVIAYRIGTIYGNSVQVRLTVFNVLGQKVAALVGDRQKTGVYQVNWEADNLPSGIYYYKLSTEQGETQTRKMVLIR